jgi:hypothetical protein
MEGMVGAMAVAWLALLVLVVVWIVLPFAIFGLKPLLRELVREQRRTNELLEKRIGAKPPAAG